MILEIQNLSPQNLWKNFAAISKIPRNSKDEGRLREYVLNQARRLGLYSVTDSVGNLLVKKEGRGESKNKPVTIVQAHLDMVCVANKGINHDFTKDPIQLIREGDHVSAQGTSLGADNGMGVAAMLALMEDQSPDTGPLELLFTVDEETGLTGALGLDPKLLRGKRLLNTDTKDEGIIYIGCAGGLDMESTCNISTTTTPDGTLYLTLRVGGLTGGHSGIDIHRPRANAIKLLAGLLREALESVDFHLVDLEGGNKSNVIPREASAMIAISKKNIELIKEIVDKYAVKVKKEFPEESGLSLHCEKGEESSSSDTVMEKESGQKLILFLLELPHGVIKMSDTLPDLVETSVNLATARMDKNKITVGMNTRSLFDPDMESVADTVKNIGTKYGFRTRTGDRYPGWIPNLESSLLLTAKNVYQDTFGNEPQVKAIHAGLETGVIGAKYPGMEIISFGPSIEDLHSPQERVNIASVERFWRFLTALLKVL